MTDREGQVGGRIVWVAVVLAAIYLAIHVPMLSRSLIQWAHLVSALVGQ